SPWHRSTALLAVRAACVAESWRMTLPMRRLKKDWSAIWPSSGSRCGGLGLFPGLPPGRPGFPAPFRVVPGLVQDTESIVDGIRIQRPGVERGKGLRPVYRLGHAGELEKIHRPQLLHERDDLA